MGKAKDRGLMTKPFFELNEVCFDKYHREKTNILISRYSFGLTLIDYFASGLYNICWTLLLSG